MIKSFTRYITLSYDVSLIHLSYDVSLKPGILLYHMMFLLFRLPDIWLETVGAVILMSCNSTQSRIIKYYDHGRSTVFLKFFLKLLVFLYQKEYENKHYFLTHKVPIHQVI